MGQNVYASSYCQLDAHPESIDSKVTITVETTLSSSK